ncbi:hypothetical protein ABZP36_015205 [Zizania latifolia]
MDRAATPVALLGAAMVMVVVAAADVKQTQVVSGLSFDFYRTSCPKAESIVRSFVENAFRRDIGIAAGLLRLHFHDCFVQSGGPEYKVPLGRRDSAHFASREDVLSGLPPPSSPGQIRRNCSARNSGTVAGDLPWSVLEAADSFVPY